MSDLAIRRAEVSGDRETLFRLRFRAGRKIPIQLEGGEPCHTVTVEDADPVAFAKLRAFLGCEVARELVFGKSMPNHSAPRDVLRLYSPPKGLPQWLQALSRLAAALPAVVVSGVACEMCATIAATACPECNGTGKRDLRVPFDQYLLVVGAVEAGRGAFAQRRFVTACSGDWDGEPGGCKNLTCQRCPPKIALDAAEAWTVCPCHSRRESLREDSTRLGGVRMFYDACHLYAIGDFDQAAICMALADTLTGTARADMQRAGLRVVSL